LALDPTVTRVDVNLDGSTTFTDTLSLIRNLVGTSQGDRLTGDGNANTLSGGAGDDTLAGGAGADVLYGDDGNDVILQDAGPFADTLAGGAASTPRTTAPSARQAASLPTSSPVRLPSA
jgi:Ca2+-binding RTX toxin-like protein